MKGARFFYSRGQWAMQPRLCGYLADATGAKYSMALLRCKFDTASACCGVFD